MPGLLVVHKPLEGPKARTCAVRLRITFPGFRGHLRDQRHLRSGAIKATRELVTHDTDRRRFGASHRETCHLRRLRREIPAAQRCDHSHGKEEPGV